MHPEHEPVHNVASELKNRFGDAPAIGLVLGSGLGPVLDRMNVEGVVDAGEIGLPVSTVKGHAGKIVVGEFGGQRIVALKGRVHLYEGYGAQKIVRYVRAFKVWGVQNLVLSCSAGGVADRLDAGDIMVLSDHINLMGDSPLIGPAWDVRFPDMSEVHDKHMRACLKAAAEEVDVRIQEGVYTALHGPAYETPAEIRMLAATGTGAVGMSTVPELLAAAECKLHCCAIAVISNKAAGLTDEVLSHSEVTAKANEVGGSVADILENAVARF